MDSTSSTAQSLTANSAGADLEALLGQPADIAASAYCYRADRSALENPPEGWVLLMQYAGLPYDTSLDTQHASITRVLCGLLWEEVRQLRTVELRWPANAPPPAVEHITLHYFASDDVKAHTWWNHPRVAQAEAPLVSPDGLAIPMPFPWIPGVSSSVSRTPPTSRHSRCPPCARWCRIAGKKWSWRSSGDMTRRQRLSYDGHLEAYDGIISELRPLADDAATVMRDAHGWHSGAGSGGRGVRGSLLYIGSSPWKKVGPFHAPPEDVARSIITVWTASGNFSFLASDLERGPILAPEYGFFVRASAGLRVADPEAPFELPQDALSAREFTRALAAKGYQTIRQRTRAHAEQSWDGAMQAMFGEKELAAIPAPGVYTTYWDRDKSARDQHGLGSLPIPLPDFEPAMKVEVPCEKLTAQWKLGTWHILRSAVRDAQGAWSFNDPPFGILAAETYMILRALDLQGAHKETRDGLRQWLRLPLEHRVTPGMGESPWLGQHIWSPADRPLGNFSDGVGCLTFAEGPVGLGAHMDGVHCMGPGAIMFALIEHFCLTGDMAWLQSHAARMKANAEWILRQRRLLTQVIPGGQRLRSAGLQPAHVVTPDSECMHMQYYETEGYYWLAVKRMAQALSLIDAAGGAAMEAEAEAYRQDLLAAVERSITLTPVMQVLDGSYHSFIPFAPYVRGLAAGAWGWGRCRGHQGATYWDTVQSSDPLIDPAHLLSTADPRVQGHLDVLEDRLLLSTGTAFWRKADFDVNTDWFGYGSWQYQCGLERHANIHLDADDAPSFLRTLLNQYAVDIMPDHEYRFHEHTTHHRRSIRGIMLPGALPHDAGARRGRDALVGQGDPARVAGTRQKNLHQGGAHALRHARL